MCLAEKSIVELRGAKMNFTIVLVVLLLVHSSSTLGKADERQVLFVQLQACIVQLLSFLCVQMLQEIARCCLYMHVLYITCTYVKLLSVACVCADAARNCSSKEQPTSAEY